MPSLKDTKRRIASVKSTQKITRAMKLVSSAKYARANRAILNAEPYQRSFEALVASLLAAGPAPDHPLLRERQERSVLLVVVATDRGLCGGLNNNLFKLVQARLREKQAAGCACSLGLWGRRAVLFGEKLGLPIAFQQEQVLEKPDLATAVAAAGEFARMYTRGEHDGVYVAYSAFENALTQAPTVEALLPVRLPQASECYDRPRTIVEPALQEIFAKVLEQQVAAQVLAILLNGAASEHAARMTAMDSATNNAQEVIRRLTLEYNRARQAAITKELIEITSGAEAL